MLIIKKIFVGTQFALSPKEHFNFINVAGKLLSFPQHNYTQLGDTHEICIRNYQAI